MNALQIFPNLIGVLALSGIAAKSPATSSTAVETEQAVDWHLGCLVCLRCLIAPARPC